jgi:hypothetical protein
MGYLVIGRLQQLAGCQTKSLIKGSLSGLPCGGKAVLSYQNEKRGWGPKRNLQGTLIKLFPY